MIDIHSKSANLRASQLSNLVDRPFEFDGVFCQSIESFLQSLKVRDVFEQTRVCSWSGAIAKAASDTFSSWKDDLQLHWRGVPHHRMARSYQLLLTRMYDTVYLTKTSFREALQAVGSESLRHSIGNPDPRETVLTEVEFIYQLNRLRLHG